MYLGVVQIHLLLLLSIPDNTYSFFLILHANYYLFVVFCLGLVLLLQTVLYEYF